MAESPSILAFSGSSRRESLNRKLLAIAVREAELAGALVTLINIGDDPLPLYDGDLEDKDGMPPSAAKLVGLVASHQGLLIASPEYNSMITPLLKNAIDWVSRVRERGDPTYAAFKGRVFAIASASPGPSGGLSSLMALRQILELGCGALVIPEQVAIPQGDMAFDAMDNIADARLANLFHAELARLVEMARLLA